MAATSTVSATGNRDIDGVLSGVKWASPSLTFSFPTALSQYGYTETGFEAMNATQQTAVRAILDMYESYTGLVLTEVTESASVHATIRFAEEDNAGTAYAYYPDSSEWGGDIWLNHTNYNTPLKGTYAYATFMHEIGHAMGLDHGQDGLAALPTNHDSLEYSVMTYRSYVGADLSGYTVAQGSYPQTLMMSDIAALQHMYGANYATNAGNSTYRWSATTGEMSINGVGQGASVTNTIFGTVWDGGGIDTYDFSNYTTNLTVDLSPGGWSTTSAAQLANLGGWWAPGEYARGNIANAYLFGGNTASLIENAIGGTGNDTITGNQANNVLDGGAGNDILAGGNGNDTIIGGLGVDYCIISESSVNCIITYDDLTAIFSIQTLLAGLDAVSGVEYFTFTDGTFAAASFTGPDLTAPLLVSSSPADATNSAPGSANIVLTFNENVSAGAGAITLHNAADDSAVDATISISGKTVTINPTVDLAPGTSYYVTVGADALSDGSGNFFAGISASTDLNFTIAPSIVNGTSSANALTGSTFSDTINGFGGNDTLYGLDGNDLLDGGSGRDSMSGGLGDDIYLVNDRRDTVVEALNGGTDTVRTSVGLTLGANVENLVLTGTGKINGTGNGLDNSITGNDANNTLSGGAGNDVLSGGLGNDVLTGGTGSDSFVFDTAPSSSNIDKITDFSTVDDTIVLGHNIFSTLSLGSLADSAFSINTPATDGLAHITYNASTGGLYYDPDGNGALGQQQFAFLATGLSLTASDFLIV